MKEKFPLEKDIQNEICEYLKNNAFFFWRSNNLPVFSRNNAGKMAFRAMGKYTLKGIPDIIVIYKGKFIGIEVKRVGAPLREDQIKFKVNTIVHGGIYIMATSVEQVRRLLNTYRDCEFCPKVYECVCPCHR